MTSYRYHIASSHFLFQSALWIQTLVISASPIFLLGGVQIGKRAGTWLGPNTVCSGVCMCVFTRECVRG